MATSLLDLIQDVAGLFGPLHEGVAETGSTAQLVKDATLIEPDDFWNRHYLYVTSASGAAPEGEERGVTDWVQATATLTVSPQFTAALALDDEYLILPVRRRELVRAINNAIVRANERWGVPTIDTSTVTIATDTYQYSLPADLTWLRDVLRRDDAQSPWGTIERGNWGVSGTPGSQVLDLWAIGAYTAGDVLRLDYVARMSELSADDDTLSVGVPAEPELVTFLVDYSLWYLHTQAANRGIAAGTFREHLTQARNALEKAEKTLARAPRFTRAGRWRTPQRPSILG